MCHGYLTLAVGCSFTDLLEIRLRLYFCKTVKNLFTEQSNGEEAFTDTDRVSEKPKHVSFSDFPKKDVIKTSTSAGPKLDQPTKTVLENLLDIFKEWITDKTLEYIGLVTADASVIHYCVDSYLSISSINSWFPCEQGFNLAMALMCAIFDA